MITKLKSVVNKLHNARVLVVGDLILDEYVWGNVERISPEAPVPVVWAVKKTYVPGGAANVAYNIRSLRGKVCLVGVVGKDREKDTFFAELEKRKIPTEGIFVEPHRHTTVKSRIIAGHQQVVRVDWEHNDPLSAGLNSRILGFFKKNIGNFDAVIIEDYGKGVVNKLILEELILLARSRKKIIMVDPKEENFQYYRGVTSITPNRKELENAVRNIKVSDEKNSIKINTDKLLTMREINLAAREIMNHLDLESLLVTLGEQGMQLFERNGCVIHIPTVGQEVFDVSGAGDTVIGTFTMGLCAGASKLHAAHIANFAAGIVVGKVGTAVTTQEELLKAIRQEIL